MNVAASVTSASLYFSPVDYGTTMDQIFIFLKDVDLPKPVHNFVEVIKCLTLVVMAYMIMIFPYVIVYHVEHIKAQFLLLNDHVEYISGDFTKELNKNMVIEKLQYQVTIYSRLRYCIKRHRMLKR